MKECGHVLLKNGVEIKCGLSIGHINIHRCYADAPPIDGPTTNFIIHMWNDNGETFPAGHEQGCEFPCDYDKGPAEMNKIMSFAIMDARKTLSAGTVFEVRAKWYPGDDYIPEFGRSKRVITRREQEEDWGIAWYCIAGLPKGFEEYETATEPLVKYPAEAGEIMTFRGYVLLARMVA